jgi:hypothetical protein
MAVEIVMYARNRNKYNMCNNIVFNNNTNFIPAIVYWSSSYALPDLTRNKMCTLFWKRYYLPSEEHSFVPLFRCFETYRSLAFFFVTVVW